MIIYKHIKLLLFCLGIRYAHFIAFYDHNDYKSIRQRNSPTIFKQLSKGAEYSGDM